MKLDIYLNYPGNCEEAFRFYEQHLSPLVPDEDDRDLEERASLNTRNTLVGEGER